MKYERVIKEERAHLIAIVSCFLDKRGYKTGVRAPKRANPFHGPQRNGRILYEFALGKDYAEIAKNCNLTSERVKQIVHKEIAMLEDCIEYDNYFRMCEKYKELKIRYDILFSQYSILKQTGKKMAVYLEKEKDAPKAKAFLRDDEKQELPEILTRRLVDMNLSVRALNCLESADIEFMWELVSFRKRDLLKYRNMGKKSLTELDDLLQAYGLNWEMDISKYILP